MKVVGTIARVLAGIVICENVLTNMCSGSRVDILFICSGNGYSLTLQWIGGLDVCDNMKFRGISAISGNWVNMTYLILFGT